MKSTNWFNVIMGIQDRQTGGETDRENCDPISLVLLFKKSRLKMKNELSVCKQINIKAKELEGKIF
jgi:hypothetical protein